MTYKRDIYLAITFSIITVLILRFISYTNLFGLAKNILHEILLMSLLAAITSFVYYNKELYGIKRSVRFIIIYISTCTFLDFTYRIFIIPNDVPFQFLLFKDIILFGITSTASFFFIYLTTRFVIKKILQK
jgi:hypothetical protein